MPDRLAFFDFDGTLVTSNVVHQYVWYARRKGDWGRLLSLGLAVPLLKAADLKSRELFNRLFYRHYRGLSEDWLRAESKSLVDGYLSTHMFPEVPALLARTEAEGFANVLVSGSLDISVEPFARRHAFAKYVSNKLEFERGIATGRLLPPVLAGAEKVEAIRAIAAGYNVSLDDCRAYSDDEADLPMLEAVGHPVATNPKPGLLRQARERNWPVIQMAKPA
ncbi:MAG: HAD-IB family hydrolase [Bryobacteraceae bacterium]